jgi:hypothetical protein
MSVPYTLFQGNISKADSPFPYAFQQRVILKQLKNISLFIRKEQIMKLQY